MLNDEVHSNNTCSEDDLKRGRVQILQFHQQNWVSSSNIQRVCEVMNDMGLTNYGSFRAGWNMKSFLCKCQFEYTKLTATYWTSSYASKLFWRYSFESWLWLPWQWYFLVFLSTSRKISR